MEESWVGIKKRERNGKIYINGRWPTGETTSYGGTGSVNFE